jgi:hypothetical protein
MSFRGRKVRDLQHRKASRVASHICPEGSLKEHQWRIGLHVIQEDRGHWEKRKYRLTVFLKNVVAVLPTLSKFFWHCRHRKVFWLRKSWENAVKWSLLHTKIQGSESVSKWVICLKYSNPMKFSGHWGFGCSENSKQTVQMIICYPFAQNFLVNDLGVSFAWNIVSRLFILSPFCWPGFLYVKVTTLQHFLMIFSARKPFYACSALERAKRFQICIIPYCQDWFLGVNNPCQQIKDDQTRWFQKPCVNVYVCSWQRVPD